ncbi:sialate O-acetylesterase [Kaistella montana]|uniref:Sialate O-acetylesterase n=1 Tax=Kaistella montana TaxID=1849733 RepID=A0ABW5K7G3_9FLAO|nr:sialate O-acetylesterase [Kaistella montana]MCQ4035121.1 sialate O-acetylesterase [Kaistella montana]
MKNYLILFSLFVSVFMMANINLPAIFTDNMVLQRNAEVVIWGSASPKEEITLKADFLDKEYKTVAGNDATFKFIIPTGKEGGPYKISLKGYNEVVLNNVMLGEVWLLSGQSNMEMSASWGIKDGDMEVSKANHPNIRFFSVPKLSSEFPQNNLYGNWQICTPETMKNFSAIGYFFAQKLQENLKNVPIGLIASAWGGSAAELWTPKEVFEANPLILDNYKKIKPSEYYPSQIAGAYNAMIYPLNDFKMKGILWYQGETNTGNPDGYKDLLASMIASWRKAKADNLPFYIIQIAGYTGWSDTTVRIKNAQRIVAQSTENSGLVVTSDLDKTDDIHPKNKKPVGIRMANLVLKNNYGFVNGLVESPAHKNVDFKENKTILQFDFAEGLHFKNKSSELFEVAGNDGIFHKAKAVLKGNQIILHTDAVAKPVEVRYAWSNVAIPDVYNKAELPLSSFTTENLK